LLSVFGRQINFLPETHCSHHHRCIGATNLFLYHLSTMICLPKTTLEPKLAGAGLGEHHKNFRTPYNLQPLKLATSNLVHNLGLKVAYPKTFRTKIGGHQGKASQKIGTPLLISATAEASNFKFVTQL